MSGRRVFPLLAALILLPGCAVPLYPKCGGWLQGKEPCLDRKSISFIVPGETTKDDVIDRIGFPTRMLRNGTATVYGYDWRMPSWAIFVGGAGGGGGGIAEKQHLLLVEFDGQGRVVRFAERTGYFIPDSEFPEK